MVFCRNKMATGGIYDDIFECSICLSDMVDRAPRSLQCLHSFCEKCLKKLIKNNRITCPTCRKPTEVKENNVQELPVNFMLKKMRDRELSKTKQPEITEDPPKTPCQICKRKNPEFKCMQCQRAMCTSCKNAHLKIKDYKDHLVFDLCQQHDDHITHMCMKCLIPLCMTCMVVEHHHHNENFLEFTEATKSIQTDVDQLGNDLQSEMSQVDLYVQQVENRSKANADLKVNLKKQRKYYEDKIKEVDALMQKSERNEKTLDKILETCKETKHECEVVTASLSTLTKDTSGYCSKYAKLHEKVKVQIEAIRQILAAKHDIPVFVLNEIVTTELVKSTEPGNITTTMGRKELKMSKLVVDIPQSKEINCVHQIDFIGDDIVLCTNKPYHVVRLNSQGQVVDRYYPNNRLEGITGVQVYNSNIYMVQPKEISVISPKDKTMLAVYKPNIDSMYKILVKDKDTIFVSEYRNPGNIYKYDINNDKTKAVVLGLNHPSYINQSKDGQRYIVIEAYEYCIRVYTDTWTFMYKFKIQGVHNWYYPRATIFTPMDTLLTADEYNHHVSHYTLDGKLLSHVITKQDGILQPVGLAFRYPYLWICSWGAYVKCFQLE